MYIYIYIYIYTYIHKICTWICSIYVCKFRCADTYVLLLYAPARLEHMQQLYIHVYTKHAAAIHNCIYIHIHIWVCYRFINILYVWCKPRHCQSYRRAHTHTHTLPHTHLFPLYLFLSLSHVHTHAVCMLEWVCVPFPLSFLFSYHTYTLMLAC